MQMRMGDGLRQYRPILAARLKEAYLGYSSLPVGIVANNVIVPDTSFYEGQMTISKTVSAGAKGIIVRAGQGVAVDTQFANTWQNAKGALRRGSYWFYDPRHEPKRQAEAYSNTLGSDTGELDLCVDWEFPDSWGGQYANWNGLYTFLERLKVLRPGKSIMIYTGYYYWLAHSPNPITQSGSLSYFGQYPLWLAWYTTNPSVVKIPKPWGDVKAWQYTDTGDGVLYGTDPLSAKSIDLNYWYGESAPPPVSKSITKVTVTYSDGTTTEVS